jgi:glyceraldehyde-3-phosphate dehydrogenase (NAD(P))
VVGSLFKAELVERAWVILARRATDPWKAYKGATLNTMVPEAHIPSHQGPDAQTVIPELPIVTIAAKGPYTISHMHFAIVKAPKEISKDDVLKVLGSSRRIALIDTADGIHDLASTMELMRLLGRPMGDMWEVGVWSDILSTSKDEAYLVYQVHNLAIVIPENIDAVRALAGVESNPTKSMDLTDKTLGVRSGTFFKKIKIG